MIKKGYWISVYIKIENEENLKKYSEQETPGKIDNPVWHLHKGSPKSNDLPVTYTLLLNLVSVCYASDPDIVWGYVKTYSPNSKRTKELDDLIDLSVNYYKEKIEPHKKYRLPNEKEKRGIIELINTLSTLNNETSSDDIQAMVFAIGKKLELFFLKDLLIFGEKMCQTTSSKHEKKLIMFSIENDGRYIV